MGTGQPFRIQGAGVGKVNLVRIEDVRFFCLTDQLFPVVRMGDVDQGLSAFPDRSTDHGCDTVFGDDQIQRFAIRKLIREILNGEQNIGAALQVPAGKSEDGPAPAGMFRPGKELLGLSRSGGDIALSDVQGNPARQVDLTSGKNGDHPVIEADPQVVGNDIDSLKLDQRIAVQPLHQLGRPLGVGGQRFITEIVLASVVDGTALDQVHQRIGKEIGVNAKIALAGEVTAERLE